MWTAYTPPVALIDLAISKVMRATSLNKRPEFCPPRREDKLNIHGDMDRARE